LTKQIPQPLPKFEFLMLARQEALAHLTTSYDAGTGLLSVTDGAQALSANVRSAEGRGAIAAFFARFLPEDQKSSQPRLVTAANHRFTDVGVHSSRAHARRIDAHTLPRFGSWRRESASALIRVGFEQIFLSMGLILGLRASGSTGN